MSPRIAELSRLAAAPQRTIVGLMSGTSLDGIDAALCRVAGQGSETRVELLAFRTSPFPADLREYGLGAQILRYLGVRHMKLLTNNPKKIAGLGGYGLDLVDQVPLFTPPNEANINYLRTKRDKLGHIFEDVEHSGDPGESK